MAKRKAAPSVAPDALPDDEMLAAVGIDVSPEPDQMGDVIVGTGADAAPAEEVIRVSEPVVIAATPRLGPDACSRYAAGTPLAGRSACPWERGRLADGTQIYHCASCGASRAR